MYIFIFIDFRERNTMLEVYIKYVEERNLGVKVSSRKTFWKKWYLN